MQTTFQPSFLAKSQNVEKKEKKKKKQGRTMTELPKRYSYPPLLFTRDLLTEKHHTYIGICPSIKTLFQPPIWEARAFGRKNELYLQRQPACCVGEEKIYGNAIDCRKTGSSRVSIRTHTSIPYTVVLYLHAFPEAFKRHRKHGARAWKDRRGCICHAAV